MKHTVLVQLMTLWSTSCHAWRTFKIILDDAAIVSLDERYVNASIGFAVDVKNESLIRFYVTVFEDIDNLMAHVTITAKTTNDEDMNVLNARGNFCRFLASRKEGNVRQFFEDVQKFGKIFLECPIKKGSYYLHDLRIDPDLTPDYLPEATFEAMAHVYFNDTMGIPKSIIKIILTGKIDKSQGLDNIKVFSMG